MADGGRAAAVAGLLLIAGIGVMAPQAPAAGTDHVARPASVPAETVPAETVPVLGDFDGDGRGDLLWYGPGAADDHLWLGRPSRSFVGVPVTVRGHYLPLGGDFDGDGRADVLWYGPGGDPDVLWRGPPRGPVHGPGAGRAGRLPAAGRRLQRGRGPRRRLVPAGAGGRRRLVRARQRPLQRPPGPGPRRGPSRSVATSTATAGATSSGTGRERAPTG